MDFEPRFLATAIGSLPHRDVREACRLMVDALPGMPVWPQLPGRSFLENMYAQYTEGLPGIVVDGSAGRVWFQVDERLEESLEEFYRSVIDEELDRFAISGSHAAGLEMFLSGEYSRELSRCGFIKGQVTGPISFGLTVTDQNRRASLYDETLEQVIVKGLTLKARWQSRELKRAFPGASVVLFFDEPYLVSVGSALLSVSAKQVTGGIGECVRGCGADMVGLHCCGNTDWSLVFETGADIISFDAFGCMEGFIAYRREIKRHLEKGGVIAWGVVPNCEKAGTAAAQELADVLERAFDELEKSGVDRGTLARKSMVTPACGLGTTTVGAASAALTLSGEVSAVMRARYF